MSTPDLTKIQRQIKELQSKIDAKEIKDLPKVLAKNAHVRYVTLTETDETNVEIQDGSEQTYISNTKDKEMAVSFNISGSVTLDISDSLVPFVKPKLIVEAPEGFSALAIPNNETDAPHVRKSWMKIYDGVPGAATTGEPDQGPRGDLIFEGLETGEDGGTEYQAEDIDSDTGPSFTFMKHKQPIWQATFTGFADDGTTPIRFLNAFLNEVIGGPYNNRPGQRSYISSNGFGGFLSDGTTAGFHNPFVPIVVEDWEGVEILEADDKTIRIHGTRSTMGSILVPPGDGSLSSSHHEHEFDVTKTFSWDDVRVHPTGVRQEFVVTGGVEGEDSEVGQWVNTTTTSSMNWVGGIGPSISEGSYLKAEEYIVSDVKFYGFRPCLTEQRWHAIAGTNENNITGQNYQRDIFDNSGEIDDNMFAHILKTTGSAERVHNDPGDVTVWPADRSRYKEGAEPASFRYDNNIGVVKQSDGQYKFEYDLTGFLKTTTSVATTVETTRKYRLHDFFAVIPGDPNESFTGPETTHIEDGVWTIPQEQVKVKVRFDLINPFYFSEEKKLT